MEPVYIAKMSVKALGCNPRKAATSEAPILLCRIYGKAEGLKHGEDKSGNVWTAISGQFEGVNVETGETFRSGKLFLPGGIQETLEAPLENAERESKAVVIQFGLEISAVQASNPIGYSYQAKSVIPVREADELEAIRNLIAGKSAPQLPAPENTEAPAQTPEPEAPKADAAAAPKKRK